RLGTPSQKQTKNPYKTAPFDSSFPNQNQPRNCLQDYLDFHLCEKAMIAKRDNVSQHPIEREREREREREKEDRVTLCRPGWSEVV
uniref:Uncharacterized protein n=1 Tax=Theropithecus gelada TaxID=9565 RepID=A0A8D2E2H4_THEGE